MPPSGSTIAPRYGILLLIAGLIVSALSAAALPEDAPAPSLAADMEGTCVDRLPENITISTDSDFLPSKGIRRGSGAPGDPYVIECWVIEMTWMGFGMAIINTTSHFVVRNVTFGLAPRHACAGGLSLRGVQNGLVEFNRFTDTKLTIADHWPGIPSENLTVRSNTFEGYCNGAAISGRNSGGIRVIENSIDWYCGLTGMQAAIEVVNPNWRGWTIDGNTVRRCTGFAVSMDSKSATTINQFRQNTFENNRRGGTPQAADNSIDFWDMNRWSDWTGPDSDRDGIVDMPYLIDGGKDRDNRPLCPVGGCDGGSGFQVAIFAAPLTGPAPLSVDFASTVRGGIPPYTYEWQLGDATNATTANLTRVYQRPANYIASLTVIDARGNATASNMVRLVVTEADAPQVVILADQTTGPAPLLVSFTGEATGGRPPYSFLWSFGDGGTAATGNPRHTYVSPGEYSASLSVTDSASKSVTSAPMGISVLTAGAPRVVSTLPRDGDIDVSPEAEVWVSFSTAMDTGATGSSVSIAPNITYSLAWSDRDTVLVIHPKYPLDPNTRFGVTVGPGARSSGGLLMSDPYVFSFKTAIRPENTPPTISHDPVRTAVENEAIELVASITDDLGDFSRSAILHYRQAGSPVYENVVMPPTFFGDHRTKIPAADVVAGVIEYYLEAIDLEDASAVHPLGGAAAPHRITVTRAGGESPDGGELGRSILLLIVAGIIIALLVAVLTRLRARRSTRSTSPSGGAKAPPLEQGVMAGPPRAPRAENPPPRSSEAGGIARKIHSRREAAIRASRRATRERRRHPP